MLEASPNARRDEGLHRLFFALWPGDALRDAIAAAAADLERAHAPGGRRSRAERYHLTLQFLGDFRPLPRSVLDAARVAADSVRLRAFDLALDHAGSFPGSRVWWLGAGETPAELRQLHEALGSALARSGVAIKPSVDFIPHLTIQRNVNRPIAPITIAKLRWPVREFVLVDSVPGGVSPYRIAGRWPLALE